MANKRSYSDDKQLSDEDFETSIEETGFKSDENCDSLSITTKRKKRAKKIIFSVASGNILTLQAKGASSKSCSESYSTAFASEPGRVVNNTTDLHIKTEIDSNETSIASPYSVFKVSVTGEDVKEDQDKPWSSTANIPTHSVIADTLTSELDIKKEISESEEDVGMDSSESDKNQEQTEKDDQPDGDFTKKHSIKKTQDSIQTESNTLTKWTKDSSSMTSFLFAKSQQILKPLPEEPYNIFRVFLDDDILDVICNITNKRAAKHDNEFTPLTRSELIIFIGLLLHTGNVSMPRLCDYWSSHYLFNSNVFEKFMDKNRFLQILDLLSFSEIEGGTENIMKLQPIVDHFNKKMEEIYYPGANLIVAKSVNIYCGNILANEENNRLRINPSRLSTVHMLAEPTGLILKLKLTRAQVDYEGVVFSLIEEKLHNGHSVYLPERYSTFNIPLTLLTMKTHCTCILSDISVERRQKYLKEIVPLEDLYSKEGSYFCDGIHLLRRNEQFYVSSQYDDEELHVQSHRRQVVNQKSKLVAMYDSVMNINLDEDIMAFYPCCNINLSVEKKAFIHMLQVILANAHKFSKGDKILYNFRLRIIEAMLPQRYNDASYTIDDTGDLPPGIHVLTKIEKRKMREKRCKNGRVQLSKEVVRKECRGCKALKKKRRGTMYECRTCTDSPGYCKVCFEKYHAFLSLEKSK